MTSNLDYWETALSTLEADSPIQEKILAANDLNNILDSYALIPDAKKSTSRLVKCALFSSDQELRRELFDLVDMLMRKNLIGFRYDLLIPVLPNLEKEYMIISLQLLAATGRSEYLELIESYAESYDNDIKEAALEAVAMYCNIQKSQKHKDKDTPVPCQKSK